MTLELLDQLVREKPGRKIVEFLRRGDFNGGFLRQRIGDLLDAFSEPASSAMPPAQEIGSNYIKREGSEK